MFKSIGREIRQLPNHVVALFLAGPALIYLDTAHFVMYPVQPGFAHAVLLALDATCLAWLYADGAAPTGPWERRQSKRRRDALRATILISVALVLHAAARELIAPLQPAMHVETWDEGRSTLAYPEVTGIGDVIALAARIVLSVAGLALACIGVCAPACAARYGLRHCLRESWRAWRRCYFRLCGLSMLAMVALIPALLLFMPLADYRAAVRSAVDNPSRWQVAIDLCNQIGVRNFALSAAAGMFLIGIAVWSYSRAVARLIEQQPRG